MEKGGRGREGGREGEREIGHVCQEEREEIGRSAMKKGGNRPVFRETGRN